VRYALLIYSDQSSWESMTDEEKDAGRAASLPQWYALFDELRKADSNAGGMELEAASEAKVVRVRDGQTLVTDGPYAETKELIGGAFVLELPDLDEAIRIAALVPAAQYGSMEIRPIVEVPVPEAAA
jgi:hypothetical protein